MIIDMKNQINGYIGLIALILASFSFLPGCTSNPNNLKWSKVEPFIVPGIVETMALDGFNISDTVYVLDDRYLTCITKTIKNASLVDLVSKDEYQIRIVVQPYARQSVEGIITFVSIDDPIYDELFSGQVPVIAGDSIQFSACPGLHLSDGFYKVSLIINPDATLNETDRTDKHYSCIINIPATPKIDIDLELPDAAKITSPTSLLTMQPVPAVDLPIQEFSTNSENDLSVGH